MSDHAWAENIGVRRRSLSPLARAIAAEPVTVPISATVLAGFVRAVEFLIVAIAGFALSAILEPDERFTAIVFYAAVALAAGAVSHELATGGVRRNMPDPIPVLVLGRLAVDRRVQGQRLGAALLRDAVQRAMNVAEHAGVRALLVHALNDGARQFYGRYGFEPSPVDPMTLMLRLKARFD